ncbi:MAG: hypothetical protein ACOYKJ_08225 [Candidatus Howiella sp.]
MVVGTQLCTILSVLSQPLSLLAINTPTLANAIRRHPHGRATIAGL